MGVEILKGISGSLDNIGSGATSDSMFGIIGSTGSVLFQVFVYIIIAAVVIFIFRQVMMYSIPIDVYKLHSTGLKKLTLKGRKYKDKSGRYQFAAVKSLFQLKPMKLPLVDQEHFIPMVGKGEMLHLLQVAPDDYKPIKLEHKIRDKVDDIELDILNQDASNHSIQRQREIVERHRSASKLLIYLPTIMMVGGMIFVVILLWMTLGRVETISNGISQAGIHVADALKDAGKCVVT